MPTDLELFRDYFNNFLSVEKCAEHYGLSYEQAITAITLGREEHNAIAFFHQNAGYSIKPGETHEEGKERSAVELAEAERWAKQQGAEYDWQPDQDGDHSYLDQAEFAGYIVTTCERVNMRIDGVIVESLGCIDDATPDYRRVIEAELASEVMPVAESGS